MVLLHAYQAAIIIHAIMLSFTLERHCITTGRATRALCSSQQYVGIQSHVALPDNNSCTYAATFVTDVRLTKLYQLVMLAVRTKAAIKLVSGSHLVSSASIHTVFAALQAKMLLGAMVVTTMVTVPMEETTTEATTMAMAVLPKATMAMEAMLLMVSPFT